MCCISCLGSIKILILLLLKLVAAVLEEHEIMADILRASAETELRRTSLTELTVRLKLDEPSTDPIPLNITARIHSHIL